MNLRCFVFLFFIVLSIFTHIAYSIRVCKSFESYQDSYNNDDCYDNPDNTLNLTEILRQRWNCTVEEYNLTTTDGYQIIVVRAYKEITYPTPIILSHGLLTNSLGFVSYYNYSVAYHIINSGRQVFFTNLRGTIYSLGHTGNITQNDFAYWTFSLHDMAQYDIPVTLDLVKSITGQKSIFIAYSMSSTVVLAYASTFPKDAANKLKGIISLATCVFFENSTSLFLKMADPFIRYSSLLKTIFNGKLFPRESVQFFNQYTSKSPTGFLTLQNALSYFVGYNQNGVSPEYFPIFSTMINDCAGHNVAQHYGQMVRARKFQQFDYGTTENWMKYNSSKPPEYKLSNVLVPVAQIIGKEDILSTVEDAKKVDSLLNPKFKCGLTIINQIQWTHLDFLVNKFQVNILLPMVLDKIATMESDNC